jgi:hypothetical protein
MRKDKKTRTTTRTIRRRGGEGLKTRKNMMFDHKNSNNDNYSNIFLIVFILPLLVLFTSIIFFDSDISLAAAIEPDESEEEESEDLLDKGDIAEIFEFGTGIFAGILFVLSLIAYRNSKSRRLIFVACAFGLFAIRTIILRIDLFVPEVESSILELILAIMGFAALALFFMAIVTRWKVKKTKSLSP